MCPDIYQLTEEKLTVLQWHHSEEKINTVKLLPENGAIQSPRCRHRQGKSRQLYAPASFPLCQNTHRDKTS